MPSDNRRLSAWSRWRVLLIAWAALALVSAAWSLSTPIGAAPDEPSHLIKAASVVRGEFIGDTVSGGQRVRVPAYIANTVRETCYARNHGTTPTDCAVSSSNPGKLTYATTSAGLYNPSYYELVGLPSLLWHDNTAIYAMRIASGVLSSLFLAVALMLISTWRRRALPLVGFATATAPMVFFMNGVINPTSLEVAATLAVFVGVLTIVKEARNDLLVERTTIVAVSAAIAVHARGLSPLWIVSALVTPFILSNRRQIVELARRNSVRIAAAAILLSTIAAVFWTVRSNSLGSGLSDSTSALATESGVGQSPLRGFVNVVEGTFDFGKGIVGVFGWLDTPAPLAVFFVWATLVGGLFLVAVITLRGRALIVSIVVAAVLVFLPALVQAAYIHSGGMIWQGRYALPLFVCAVVAWAAVLSDRLSAIAPSIERRLLPLVAVAWALAQAYSAAQALKRYALGDAGGSWAALVRHPLWSPPGGVGLSLALIAASALVAGAMLLWLARTRQDDQSRVL